MILFPDNTVLINFAIIGRLDLLERLLHDDGRWCWTVAVECSKSAAYHPALSSVSAFLGTPLTPDQGERVTAKMHRDSMAKPGDEPWKHFGEAETIAIATNRYAEAVFLTDDTDAMAFAFAQNLAVADTWQLLYVAEKHGAITTDERNQYEAVLAANHRKPPKR